MKWMTGEVSYLSLVDLNSFYCSVHVSVYYRGIHIDLIGNMYLFSHKKILNHYQFMVIQIKYFPQ